MNQPTNPRSLNDRVSDLLSAWDGTAPVDPSLLPPEPYPGLRSFSPSDSALFCGRRDHIKQLRQRLESQNTVVVLGGSGSGKSSLVRAGLLPNLTGLGKINERVGRWYVAEFRPRSHPIDEMLDAIWKQICEPAHRSNGADDDTLSGLRAKLEQDLRRGDELASAVVRFARETLDQLEDDASELRAGPPTLLLLIDQFEELFRDEVEPASRNALINLVIEIFTEQPKEVYLAITLRSEELHHCVEYKGLANVVNKGFYLLDLMSEKSLRLAIVEPVHSIFREYNLPNSDDPFEAGVADKLLYQAQAIRDHLNHKADQLPLLQHALRVIWGRALRRWYQAGNMITAADVRIMNIDLPADTDAWLLAKDATGAPLWACLNTEADGTYFDALQGLAQAYTDEDDQGPRFASRVLEAAFVTLARRDDLKRWVRRFARVEDVLAASGTSKREAVQQALDLFVERRYLTEKDGQYDVCHEALIRGWGRYHDWLTQAEATIDALTAAAREIRVSIGKKTWPEPPTGALPRSWEWLFNGRGKIVDDVIPPSIDEGLEQVFGPATQRFSHAWAAEQIAKDVNPGMSSGRDPSEDEERTAREYVQRIRKGRPLAREWREWRGWRGFSLLIVAAVTILGFGGARYYAEYQQNRALLAQKHLMLVHAVAADVASDHWIDPRAAAFELRAAIAGLQKDTREAGQTWGSSELRLAWAQVDKASRSLLGSTIAVEQGSAPQSTQRATCMFFDSSPPTGSLLMQVGGANLGLGRAANGDWTLASEIAGDKWTLEGPKLFLPNSIQCISADASLLLIWPLHSTIPSIYSLQWFCARPGSPNCLQFRGMLSVQSIGLRSGPNKGQQTNELQKLGASLFATLQWAPPGNIIPLPVESFATVNGTRGFAISPGPNQRPFLFESYSELAEAKRMPSNTKHPDLVPCEWTTASAASNPSGVPLHTCFIPGQKLYQRAIELKVEASPDSSDPSLCDPHSPRNQPSQCNHVIELHTPNEEGTEVALARIPHVSALITKVGLDDNYIWLEDKTGSIWRVVVAHSRLAEIAALRSSQWPDGQEPSWVCKASDCLSWLPEDERPSLPDSHTVAGVQ